MIQEIILLSITILREISFCEEHVVSVIVLQLASFQTSEQCEI